MKPIVFVSWHDAQDHSEAWANEADVAEWSTQNCLILSVGFLVSKTEKYVTLAADWDEDDKNYGRITKIPAGMVVELKELSPSHHPSPDPSVDR